MENKPIWQREIGHWPTWLGPLGLRLLASAWLLSLLVLLVLEAPPSLRTATYAGAPIIAIVAMLVAGFVAGTVAGVYLWKGVIRACYLLPPAYLAVCGSISDDEFLAQGLTEEYWTKFSAGCVGAVGSIVFTILFFRYLRKSQ